MKNRLIHYIKRLFKIIGKPELKVLPGQVAYFLVLSLIPLVSLIGIIASKFSVSIEEFSTLVSGTLPTQIMDIVLPALRAPSFGAGISILVGFFLASNASSSLIVTSNMLYKIEENNYIARRVKAIIMLVVFIFLLLFVLVVMAYGTTIMEFVYNFIFDSKIPTILTSIFLLFKWTIGIIIMFFMIKIIFAMAPNAAIPSKSMNKGAIFTTISWVGATYLFSIYVTNFSNYNLFYSSLANLVILMIWIYILSYSLVIGIAINSDSYLRNKEYKK